jgi:TP901 family phage tail tape measure protein
MPAKTVKPTADFSQIVKEIKSLAKGWNEVAKEQVKANKQAAAIAKGLSTQSKSIVNLTKEIKKLNKSYRDLVNQQKSAVQTTKRSVKVDKDKSREIAKQIKLTDRMIQRGYTFRDIQRKQATTGEVLDYKNQVGRLKELQKQHSITHAKVQKMWGSLATGNIQAYTGAERRVLNQLAKIQAAQTRLGATTRKTHSREMLARYDAEAAAFFKQHGRIENLAKATDRAKKSADSLTISWRSFIRLLAVQVFHQAVSALIRSIRDAITEVIELEKRIAEVQTISQNIPLPFERWRVGLKQVSDAFGLPILDTVEGAYQTLSNQITEGARTLTFMTDVSKFAITSVASTADSVNLLTAALNAFNLNIDNTEEVAAKFFKTIELGRVRAAEMANTFGRIAVPANQLTIRIEELQAAIAASTIQGLKYNEAATLIRNVLLKLIRPTDEMKKLFAEWGVESGEAAIKTFGFANVLAKIEEYAQGSSTELGELFGRIRAITGAMLFAGKGLERYNNALEEITNSQESYGKAAEIVLTNVGKRLDIELNKIKNFFIEGVDLWIRRIDILTDGFEGLMPTIKTLIDLLRIGFTAAITAAAFKVVQFTIYFKTLNAVMARNLFLLTALAAVSIDQYLKNLYQQRAERIDEEIKENQEEWKKRELRNVDDVFEERLKAATNIHKEELKFLAERARVGRGQLQDEEAAYKRFIKLNKRLGNEVTATLKKNISRLRKEIRELDKLIDRSEEKRDLETGKEDIRIGRLLTGVDRPDQLEPTVRRKYELLNAVILQAQRKAREAAAKLDEDALEDAKDTVLQYTNQLLALRDQNKELTARIHGTAFYNKQVEKIWRSEQLLAQLAAKRKLEAEGEVEHYRAMAIQAQRLVDHLSEKTLTDFLNIDDPLMLEAVMSQQIHAVQELLKMQRKLGGAKDPATLEKAIADIKITAANQVFRLATLEHAARLQQIQKEFQLRQEKEKELVKLLTEARRRMIHTVIEEEKIKLKEMIFILQSSIANIPRRAAGGIGIDSQTVHVSPDEMIMNPAASRRFYSTLTAMNAGIQRFAGGGAPTQYNIGDINLTADAGGGKIDIVSLGKGLRREIRRGRLRLN